MSPAELYDRDFYEWTLHNAELLRSGRAAEADLDHIAEEIEDMGKRERRELVSRLGVLIGHLLKWQAQPDHRSRSWEATIRLQREEISDLLAEMPSLRRHLEANLAKAYRHGAIAASAETRLPVEDFPSTSPFGLDVLLDAGFLP
jgi:plasmid stabilization system protein ParE